MPPGVTGPITAALEAQLNKRQKAIMREIQKTGTVTRGWCVAEFKIAKDTAGRDLKGLTKLGLIQATGKGRAVRYFVKTTDDRPAKS